MDTIKVQLDLPSDLFAALSVPQVHLNDKILELISVELVREDRISSEKVAELMGVSEGEVILMLAQHGVETMTATPDEFRDQAAKAGEEHMELRETRAPYFTGAAGVTNTFVPLSVDVPSAVRKSLEAAANQRHIGLDALVRELLTSSAAVLTIGSIYEDTDSLAVRRELAAASLAALGDFWDNEVDAQWQTFQP